MLSMKKKTMVETINNPLTAPEKLPGSCSSSYPAEEVAQGQNGFLIDDLFTFGMEELINLLGSLVPVFNTRKGRGKGEFW